MSNTITIKEYEFLCSREDQKNYVKQFDEIEQFLLKNDTYEYLKIVYKKGYGKVLQAQNYVGVIQTKDGTTIEILPKIAEVNKDEDVKKILIKMLKTLKNSPFKNLDHAHLKQSKMPLLEIFITMFLVELAKLIQRGIKNDYISKEENLTFLKGKINIVQNIKQNYVHQERFYVKYEDYISDRIENRLIKSTLEYLYKKSKTSTNQQRIREFLFVFDNVKISSDLKNDFSRIRLNRQMKDYEQILLWCKTFLFGNSFSPHHGDDIAFALLFDMNLLFESYVSHWFKKNMLDKEVKMQDKSHHLAYLDGKHGKFQLKPDIVIDSGEIIADTKWKLLNEDKTHQGVSQSDMYQLFAYGSKYKNCSSLYLIYPKQENTLLKENTYCFDQQLPYSDNNKLQLQVRFFDLYKDKMSDDFDQRSS